MSKKTHFQNDFFLRAADIRRRYSISNPTLYRWIISGKIPNPEYLNNQRVWRLSDLEAAEEQLLSTSTDKPGGAK